MGFYPPRQEISAAKGNVVESALLVDLFEQTWRVMQENSTLQHMGLEGANSNFRVTLGVIFSQ